MAVDALDPTWINAPGGVGPTYDAEELRRLDGFQLTRGATAGTARTGILNIYDLDMTMNGSSVMVGAGGAVIGTAKGAYVTGLAANTNIGTLTAADVTNPRRDRIVLEILDPDNGGGAGRKAQCRIIPGTPNALAASGGGYPAEPPLAITLGWVDVPKSGGGAAVLTSRPPITAAAGGPIPVWTKAERDALPKWDGLTVVRLDLQGLTQSVAGGAQGVWVNNYAAPFRHWRASSNQAVPSGGGEWNVSLPSGLFTVPPNVLVSKGSGAGAGLVPYVVSVTTSSVRIGVYGPAGSGYTMNVILDCVQMMPNSAGGAIGD